MTYTHSNKIRNSCCNFIPLSTLFCVGYFLWVEKRNNMKNKKMKKLKKKKCLKTGIISTNT